MSTGSTQDPTHAALGAAPVSELVLPLNARRPVSGRVCDPLLNVVAETVTFQPDPVPLLSLTVIF